MALEAKVFGPTLPVWTDTDYNKGKPLRGVNVGSYGQLITVTFTSSGVAQDITAYSGTKTMVANSPSGRRQVTATLTFVVATDGTLSFNWASGDINRDGMWTVQIELLDASANRWISDPFGMEVHDRFVLA